LPIRRAADEHSLWAVVNELTDLAEADEPGSGETALAKRKRLLAKRSCETALTRLEEHQEARAKAAKAEAEAAAEAKKKTPPKKTPPKKKARRVEEEDDEEEAEETEEEEEGEDL